MQEQEFAPVQQLMEIADGNPGAATALATFRGLGMETLINTIIAYELRGPQIYVIWNDVCKQDAYKMDELFRSAPKGEIITASNLHDRSGYKMLNKWL